jgi:hypothetical protein
MSASRETVRGQRIVWWGALTYFCISISTPKKNEVEKKMGLLSSARMTTRSHAAKDHALSLLRPIPHPAPIFRCPIHFLRSSFSPLPRAFGALATAPPFPRCHLRIQSTPFAPTSGNRAPPPRPPPAASPCVGIQSTSAPSPQDPVAVDIRSFSLLSPTYIWYQMLADAAVHCLPPCAVASLASICKPPPHSPPSACVGLRAATSLRPHAQQFVHLSTFF